ncbi:hypothetical protein [Nesterenkonia suensis]
MTTSPESRRRRLSPADLDGDAAKIARRRRRFAIGVGVALSLLVGYPVFHMVFLALVAFGADRPWAGWLLGGFALACLPAVAAVTVGTGSLRRGLLHGLWTGASITVLAVGGLLLIL